MNSKVQELSTEMNSLNEKIKVGWMQLWWVIFYWWSISLSPFPPGQTEKFYFAQEFFFSCEKFSEMSDIFTENLWQTKESCSQKVFLSNRSEIYLVLGLQRHFVQTLEKWLAQFFYNLKNFVQISMIKPF